jgi:hypothetical protein
VSSNIAPAARPAKSLRITFILPEQTGNGQGIGGFVTIAAGVLGPDAPAVEVHSIG